MRWCEISVAIPAESFEAAAAALLDVGCKGVAETEGRGTIVGYLPASEGVQAILEGLKERLGGLPEFGLPSHTSIDVRFVSDADWENAWKSFYKPIEIGRRLVIKPSWESYEGDPERVIVELDPGMAFGTGSHPTTRLCLEALEQCVQAGMVVADIGTGSGILALAAAKLGAAIVHATDIDSLPRKIARENVELAGLAGEVIIHEMDAFDTAAHNCDLVVANILADIVIDLTPSVFQRLKPGGIFISSGIVEERESDVRMSLIDSGFEIRDVRGEDIWRAFIAVRPEG